MDRIAHFSRLLEQHPANDLFRFSLAQALIAGGRGAEAENHLRHCAAAKADWMMARIILGKLLIDLGRPADARPILTEALRLAEEQHHDDPAAELQSLLSSLG